MNRNITEPFSLALPSGRQGEFFHRYILGVYELYRRVTEAFPEVLFESCASGGGRFDAGLLAFAPQAWTSDDTDAIQRAIDAVEIVFLPKGYFRVTRPIRLRANTQLVGVSRNLSTLIAAPPYSLGSKAAGKCG